MNAGPVTPLSEIFDSTESTTAAFAASESAIVDTIADLGLQTTLALVEGFGAVSELIRVEESEHSSDFRRTCSLYHRDIASLTTIASMADLNQDEPWKQKPSVRPSRLAQAFDTSPNRRFSSIFTDDALKAHQRRPSPPR